MRGRERGSREKDEDEESRRKRGGKEETDRQERGEYR